MALAKDIPRNLVDRGLDSRFPKPNILRIEVLTGAARKRYLGGLQRAADGALRTTLENLDVNTKGTKDKVFYGFIQNTSGQGYGLSAAWDTAATGGGVLGTAKAAISGGLKFATKKLLQTDKDIDLASHASEIAQELTGINANVTGSSSLKRYTGSSLTQDFTVKCGWYLPEQFNLCVYSLRILHKMIYPRKVDESTIGDNFVKALNTPTSDAGGGETFARAIGDAFVWDAGAEFLVEAFTKINRFFGRELAYDPLPVRVSVGQYMDLEPLVITGLDVSFSKETYINKEGRHVPITCSVTLRFKFWMNPSPDLQFLSLCGEEMFGITDEGVIAEIKKRDDAEAKLDKERSDPKNAELIAAENSLAEHERNVQGVH